MSDPSNALDEALRRGFAVPDLTRLHAAVDQAAALAPTRRRAATRRRVGWIALAAATVTIAIVIGVSRREPSPIATPIATAAGTDDDARRRVGAALVELHRDAATRADASELGPVAAADCVDDGQPSPRLTAADALTLVAVVAQATDDGSCSGGAGLPVARLFHLRRDDGVDVLVSVDAVDQDPRPLLPPASGLRVFRRELAGFVLYEITTLDEPLALDRFGP